jgi:SAM-dependent methyltransferase
LIFGMGLYWGYIVWVVKGTAEMSEHHDHPEGHGHQHDRGWRAVVRYLRLSRKMWTSPVNRAVIALLDLRTDERVLDIGAGMGPSTVLAAQAGAHVVAVDPMPFMRGVLGARRLWQRSRKRIEVIDGAVEHLPVQDASVDATWAVNAMHHWTDLRGGVAELHRVLRPGGRLVLVDEKFDDPSHPDHDRVRNHRHKHHHEFDDVDPAAVGAQLTAAGFTVSEAGETVLAGRPSKLVRATRT